MLPIKEIGHFGGRHNKHHIRKLYNANKNKNRILNENEKLIFNNCLNNYIKNNFSNDLYLSLFDVKGRNLSGVTLPKNTQP